MLVTVVILAVLLIVNGLFAMAELAMMTSRQSRLQQSARAGGRGAAAALVLAREPTRFLSTVQVGITLIGILAGAFGENSLSGHFEPIVASVPALAPYADTISLALVVVLITYFSLVVGELVPKRIALAYPEAVASTIARPLGVLSVVTAWPVRVLTISTEALLRLLRVPTTRGDEVSEDDVKALMSRATMTGIFMPQELKLFQRIIRAGDLVVRDLMVARTDIAWLDESETVDMVRVRVGTSPYSHFPVCKGDLDHLLGVVHIKDLIAFGLLAGERFRITEVMQKPMFVPESMPALRLLDQFQQTKVHIAFVVDEYGGTQGMLTLNDVTSAIVGDVSRRGEAGLPTMTRRGDREWLVDGRLPLRDLIAGLDLPPEIDEELPDVSTAAGLVTALLGHLPVEGEQTQWQGLRFEIIDMDGTRVDKILVSRVES